ncbi:TrkA family potassium uptake protein [bacterium]|jgi:trk system potassium uptake protein TrkA|nr:TrkA family potassium uptake protein [bacterium]
MYIIVVGCGRIGSQLAKLLQDEHNVVVVDKEEKSLQKLGDSFNGLVITGDGLDLDVLKEAGIEKADALAITTSNDNTNIVISHIAKKIFNLSKVISRVSDTGKDEIYRNLGVDSVNSTAIFATLIREKIVEKSFTTYVFESDKVTVIEIKNNGQYVGRKIETMNIPGDFHIISIVRQNEVIIPEANMVIEGNDRIIGIVRLANLRKVKKVFGIK